MRAGSGRSPQEVRSKFSCDQNRAATTNDRQVVFAQVRPGFHATISDDQQRPRRPCHYPWYY